MKKFAIAALAVMVVEPAWAQCAGIMQFSCKENEPPEMQAAGAKASDLLMKFYLCGQDFAQRYGFTHPNSKPTEMRDDLIYKCSHYFREANDVMVVAGNEKAKSLNVDLAIKEKIHEFQTQFEEGRKSGLAHLSNKDLSNPKVKSNVDALYCSLNFFNKYGESKLDSNSLYIAIDQYCLAERQEMAKAFLLNDDDASIQKAMKAYYDMAIGKIVLKQMDNSK